MIQLYNDAYTKDKEKTEFDYQYNKPLSKLELEWVELKKRLFSLFPKEMENDKNFDRDLKRWEQLGSSGIIRKSLLDDSHPIMKEK